MNLKNKKRIGTKMKFNVNEIKKNTDGITFSEVIDIKNELIERNPEIQDIKNITAKGQVKYENDIYFLEYVLNYDIILLSSRSMEDVELKQELDVLELFKDDVKNDISDLEFDEELFLPIEENSINLSESVIDNILMNIPLRVLTDQEQKSDVMPKGDNWTVLTESQYEEIKEEKKAEENPFAALSGLFDDE